MPCCFTQEIAARGPRPIVFAVFSGAAKACHWKVLQLAEDSHARRLPRSVLAPAGSSTTHQPAQNQRADQPGNTGALAGTLVTTRLKAAVTPAGGAGEEFDAVFDCVAGSMYDSLVDFTSSAGVELVATALPPGGLLRAAGHAAANFTAGTLYFALYERFEADRARMWAALRNSSSTFRGATLFLYSLDDPIADCRLIRDLAAALRHSSRRPVIEQVWVHSDHVAHLRAHPVAYHDAVKHLLQLAMDDWEIGRRTSDGDGCSKPFVGGGSHSATSKPKPEAAVAAAEPQQGPLAPRSRL